MLYYQEEKKINKYYLEDVAEGKYRFSRGYNQRKECNVLSNLNDLLENTAPTYIKAQWS